MTDPFAHTMTPPFTGELWRASALHRRVRNKILVRRERVGIHGNHSQQKSPPSQGGRKMKP